MSFTWNQERQGHGERTNQKKVWGQKKGGKGTASKSKYRKGVRWIKIVGREGKKNEWFEGWGREGTGVKEKREEKRGLERKDCRKIEEGVNQQGAQGGVSGKRKRPPLKSRLC